MSITFSQAPFEKQHALIEAWKFELEFYESEIRSCEWSLEQFLPNLTAEHLLNAARDYQEKFKKKRGLLHALREKLTHHQVKLNGDGADPAHAEDLTSGFDRLEAEVNACRDGYKGLLPDFDNFLRSCEG